MDEGIYYVVQRYNDLYDLLKAWGYEPFPDPDFDGWQEIMRDSAETGHVKVTGTRDNGDGTHLTFKFEEFWVKGDRGEDAVLVREDGSLWGYYYHGQAPKGGMRWCVDLVGHADNPCHVHPFASPETADAEPCEPVTAWEALETFEQQVYLDDCSPSEDE
jgi:hypothetical protein